MTKTLALLALLRGATAGAAFAAGAEDDNPHLPALHPPKHWRLLTHYDSTTTSKCIGQTATPLCAIETRQACQFRRVVEWCRVAVPDIPPEILDDVRRSSFSDYFLLYRVISDRRLRQDTIDHLDRLTPDVCTSPGCRGRGFWRTGDARVIVEEKR